MTRHPTPTRRRALSAGALLLLPALAGCGFTPLYADHATEAGDLELRAVTVAPIGERTGQRLELELRAAFNPDGIPTPQRYVLHTSLTQTLQDFGIQSQGLGTVGQVDILANYTLADIKTGAVLLKNLVHVAQSFDISPNGYVTVVAQNDALVRAIDELRDEMIARLTLFMQRRAAPSPKP